MCASVLHYGILAWGGAKNNVINSLEILNKCVIKTIFNKPKLYSTCKLYSECSLLSIKNQFTYQAILYLIRNSEYKLCKHNVKTRLINKNYIFVPKIKKGNTVKSYEHHAKLHLNKLPVELRVNLLQSKTKNDFYEKMEKIKLSLINDQIIK